MQITQNTPSYKPSYSKSLLSGSMQESEPTFSGGGGISSDTRSGWKTKFSLWALFLSAVVSPIMAAASQVNSKNSVTIATPLPTQVAPHVIPNWQGIDEAVPTEQEKAQAQKLEQAKLDDKKTQGKRAEQKKAEEQLLEKHAAQKKAEEKRALEKKDDNDPKLCWLTDDEGGGAVFTGWYGWATTPASSGGGGGRSGGRLG